MRRTRTSIALCLVAACLAWLVVPSAQAQPTAKRVVIVLAPYLTWSDIGAASTPTIWSLASDGAVGDINARSRTREPGEPPSPLEGALTISAGAWAVPEFGAAAAFNVDERYEVGTAAEAFRRITGDQVGSNRIVFLGFPMTERTNAERGPDAVLGTLGETVQANRGLTAAIGNSDVGYVTGEQRRVRPAALAAMNGSGLVALGDVSPRLVKEDPHAPFGIRTDIDRFDRALVNVAEQTAGHPGPSLVVLDPGDLYRAQKFEAQVTTGIAALQRRAAVATLDSVVRLAAERFGDDTVLMVVSQATGDPATGRPEGLGPVIVSGAGWSGFVTSNSTQREGLVTNLDVTATVLDIMGIERPVRVLGNAMRPAGGTTPLEERVDQLRRMDLTAVAVDSAKPGVVNSFVLLTVVALVLAGFLIVRGRQWRPVVARRWAWGVHALLLFVLCVPVSSWLTFLWLRWPRSPSEAALGLLATVIVVWVVTMVGFRRRPIRVPVAVLSLATVLVVLIDQWLGAPASFTNFLGYSPLLAARFYGLGNEAAAIIFGAAIVGAALLFDQWPEARATRIAKRIGLPVLGVLVVGTSAAPFFGANIGVAIWGVVGFGLAWVLMNDHHVSWKSVFWMFVGAAAVIFAFAAIDLFGGGSQTHLARSLETAGRGGLGELWLIIARKAATNLRVLTRTNWSYILIATLGFLAVMRFRPQGDFAATLEDNRHFADAITVSLVAGLVAYFTEDSGIVIPALEVFYVGVALAAIMVARFVASHADTSVDDREVTV